jgi:hypothetical protein
MGFIALCRPRIRWLSTDGEAVLCRIVRPPHFQLPTAQTASLFPRADVQLCVVRMRNAKTHLSKSNSLESQQC